MGKPKSSRKGKKEWRKNIGTEWHDTLLEKEAKDFKSGGNLQDLPNEGLFFVDKEKDLGVKRKVDKFRNKVLKFESILKRNELVAPISWPANPKPQLGKDKAMPPAVKKAALPVPKKDAAEAAADEAVVPEDPWAETERGRRVRRAKKPRVEAVPAVEVDMPGCSYNPTFDSHQDALAVAVAHEMTKVLKKELEPEKVKIMLPNFQEEMDEEMRFFLETGDVDEEEEPDEPESYGGGTGPARPPQSKKLTKTDLNRRKRRIAQEKAAQEKQQKQQLLSDIDRLDDITEAVDEETAMQELICKRRDVVKQEKRATAPPRLGKIKFEPAKVQVLLSEELSGSLRKLKACYTLAKDRFKSFQRRGILEPRVCQHRAQRKKRKVYEQGTRGQREREMHEATLAEREAQKTSLLKVET